MTESRLRRTIAVVVIVMAVLSAAMSAYNNYRLNAQTKSLNSVIACQTRYYLQMNDTLDRRAASAADERNRNKDLAAAAGKMWTTLLSLAPDQPGRQTPAQRDASIVALNEYLTANDAFINASETADATRKGNPLPDVNCPALPIAGIAGGE